MAGNAVLYARASIAGIGGNAKKESNEDFTCCLHFMARMVDVRYVAYWAHLYFQPVSTEALSAPRSGS